MSLVTAAGIAATLLGQAAPALAAQISYGGFLYDDHSASTRIANPNVPLGGTFQVVSTTLRFHSGQRIFVLLEDVNRIPGSSGVTRFSLTSFRWVGGTLTVRGPDHPIFRNRTFRVVVSTWEYGRPNDIALPGTITVR
jgi:hypothetical protein